MSTGFKRSLKGSKRAKGPNRNRPALPKTGRVAGPKAASGVATGAAQYARLFKNGGSQAVRLPAEFRFEGINEVRIRRDPLTGDVVLSARKRTGAEFLALRDKLGPFAPDDFDVLRDRDHQQTRVLFDEDASC